VIEMSVATSYSLVTERADCQASVEVFGTFGALLTAARGSHVTQQPARRWVMIPVDEGILGVWELAMGQEGGFTLSPAK
jgi:hypothetical protein